MPYKNKLVGIYKITNIVNDKIYVGQSIAIKQRWSQHKAELRKNKHGNCHLQKAWNKYGEEKFKFSVLEYLDTDISKDFLTEREQYWIDYYDSSNKNLGYNICPLAATCLGKETSEQGRINIKKGLIQRWERADILDKVHISTLSQRMINEYGVGFYIQSNKLTEEEVLEIKQLILDNVSNVDISQKYSVNACAISSIRLGKTWSHITGFKRKKKKSTRISKDDVNNIINLSNNYSNIEISKMLNMSIDTVKNVTNGLTWTNITGLTKNTKPKKSKVVQLDLNNNLLNTFDSQINAGKYLQLDKVKGISDCCNHRQNTAYGYKWMLYDEYIIGEDCDIDEIL